VGNLAWPTFHDRVLLSSLLLLTGRRRREIEGEYDGWGASESERR